MYNLKAIRTDTYITCESGENNAETVTLFLDSDLWSFLKEWP